MATPGTPAAAPLNKRSLPRAIAIAAICALGALLVVAAIARYGVLLPQARLLIESSTNGLKIGRLGRLRIEGLSGDVWRDLRVRRLTIRDEKGVWLEADDLHVTWNYLNLLRRRFDADLIEARAVTVMRRPSLGPKSKDTGLPVSFHIGHAAMRLDLEPAFSGQRGVYDLRAKLDVARQGGSSGVVGVKSVLHAGDHLDLDFALGGKGPLHLRAAAVEATGGALAGALGLPSDQPFSLNIQAAGTVSQGRFTARATSGALAPLVADGTWDPHGGQAGGRILLTASKLTAPYAQRFGGEVLFGIAGRKAERDLYALDARLRSEALVVHAWGSGDLGKGQFGPQGVRLEAQAASVARLAGVNGLGAGRTSGLFTGAWPNWRFAGTIDVADVTAGSYGLTRVAGPVQLADANGGLSVSARLSGAGGRGDGYVAAILGGAPTVSLEADRLANGQLLLRRLDARGRGLSLQASGGRSLLGAVNLKGKAEVSNLAAARIGASGGATVAWNAQQARADAPWTLDLDARGDHFAVGMAELDRLLGPQPRLKALANWQAGRLSVARADLTGAAAEASVAGMIEPAGAVSLKADWSANGPFHAGPVEIDGKVRGSGGVTGTVAAPRLDLVADMDAIDAPRLPLKNAKVALTFQRMADGSSGMIAVTAASPYGPAHARSDFRFPTGGVQLTGLDLDAGGVVARGSLVLRRATPSAADLSLEVRPGALIDAGELAGTVRIADAPGGARAAIELHGHGIRPPGSDVTLQSFRLTSDGPLAQLPYAAVANGQSPQGAWSLDGRGVLNHLDSAASVSFAGAGKLGERQLRTLEPAVLHFGNDERSAHLRLASADGGRLSVDGALRGQAAEVKANVAALDLRLFDPDLAGKVDADLSLQGVGGHLGGSLDARLAQARARGSPADQGIDGSLRARVADNSIALDVATTNAHGLKANASFVLPAEASAAPFRIAVARTRPMQGRFSAEGQVRPLFDLLIGGEQSLSGVVNTQGAISGTLAAPRATGQVSLDQGRFDDGVTGLTLQGATVRAAFTQDGVNVSEARADDGRGGQLSGQGRISLLRDGISSFRLDLKNFRLIDNEMAVASATGQATINRGADGKVKLTGDLMIDRADVAANPPVPTGVVPMDVTEINRPADLPVAFPGASKPDAGWALDVKLRAPRRVFLRGRGLDMELSLDAHVGGTTSEPALSGTAHVVRGSYDFAGKRFDFDTQSVVFLSTDPKDIRLQLDATRDDPSLSVTVQIRGTAEKPEITFTSSPSLPNDEILAQLLFGRSASQLSGLEAAQLAAAVSTMAGGGGLDVLGNVRSFARLDRLAIGGDQTTGLTVSGGKYVTEDVYVELTGGAREGPSAELEWRIRKNLSILSRIAGQAGNRIAIRWRNDY